MSPVYISTLIGLGLIPSLVWFSLFLKNDSHPEPKYLLTQTFLMGIIVSPVVLILQIGFVYVGASLSGTPAELIQISSYYYIWAAFAEEFLKFAAIWFLVLRNPAFDEPVDAMIYMIAAGLGFAAIENILVLFRTIDVGLYEAVSVWALRFIGSTLLHALASAIVGYFLAMSWFFQDHKKKLIVIGLVMATVFHFTFNIIIATFAGEPGASDPRGLIYSTTLLLFMAFLVSVLFDKIKERHRGAHVALASYKNKPINLLR
ncbi:MAG: PrsW family intramembrane metalloprotease [Candidatus Yanofskybacteria bacterium]|nr:PrsW family intramembrane metalloprotease [Candidatus Yanofskybacteria bacterium]